MVKGGPDEGGNTTQYDDGRDEFGRLPEPLDAAHYPPVEGGPAIVIQGMALAQRAGTGPVISSPPPAARLHFDVTTLGRSAHTCHKPAAINANVLAAQAVLAA